MKYVLITGASQGLGSSLAKVFIKKYNVIIGYFKNEELANKLKNELSKNTDNNIITYKIDIRNEADVKTLFNKYNIEILINNASLSSDNYIGNKTYKEFMEVISTNLGGTYLMCKYAKDAKYIINISSKDGIDDYSTISMDYSSSKAGIINLTKNLSNYYKDKKIYVVCPGWINTESTLEMNPLYLKEELIRVKQKELLDKDYVSKKIYDLIDSNIKSGSVVIIDE